MAIVQGIGGVFIDSQDAGRLAGWDLNVLGSTASTPGSAAWMASGLNCIKKYC